MINKTYRFRLLPTKEQEVLLNQHFGHSRWVYNHFLNERKEQYQADKKSDNYYKQAATLTKLKKEEAYRDWETDRKSTRLNSSHITRSRMPSSA